MSRSRKHGVFAESGDLVVFPTKHYDDIRDTRYYDSSGSIGNGI